MKLRNCSEVNFFQGYVVQISGDNDKQGFPMKQGVLTTGHVRLLLGKGHTCFRPRRSGERRRKSVRGCIVDANLSVISLVIITKGMVLFLGPREPWTKNPTHLQDFTISHTTEHCILWNKNKKLSPFVKYSCHKEINFSFSFNHTVCMHFGYS